MISTPFSLGIIVCSYSVGTVHFRIYCVAVWDQRACAPKTRVIHWLWAMSDQSDCGREGRDRRARSTILHVFSSTAKWNVAFGQGTRADVVIRWRTICLLKSVRLSASERTDGQRASWNACINHSGTCSSRGNPTSSPKTQGACYKDFKVSLQVGRAQGQPFTLLWMRSVFQPQCSGLCHACVFCRQTSI